METLLQIGLSNAAAAAVLSLAAAGLSQILRRPPITRALWLLVLLKLITPPLWTIHVPLHVLPPPLAPLKSAVAQDQNASPQLDTFALPAATGTPTFAQIEDTSGDATPLPPARPARPGRVQLLLAQWPLLVVVAWISGCAIYIAAVMLAALRLQRLLKYARPAPSDVLARVSDLSGRLGCRCAPQVRFTDLPVAPMLCAIGMSPRLILPAALWDRLGDAQRDVVLAHELAHLRRGDHYVRLLELIVSALYWWHPVVWWARCELREATEQCCDAWVLWAIPQCTNCTRCDRSFTMVRAVDLRMGPHVSKMSAF